MHSLVNKQNNFILFCGIFIGFLMSLDKSWLLFWKGVPTTKPNINRNSANDNTNDIGQLRRGNNDKNITTVKKQSRKIGSSTMKNSKSMKEELKDIALAPYYSAEQYFGFPLRMMTLRGPFVIKWNANGEVESNYIESKWLNTFFENLPEAKPNTVALVYSSDSMDIFNSVNSFEPQVPMLMFTVPNRIKNKTWTKVVPTPYELIGFVQWQIKNAKEGARGLSFQDKIPIMMYRGSSLLGSSWKRWSKTQKNPREELYNLGNYSSTSYWINATESAKLPVEEMSRYRYLLDIGGMSGTTWGALHWKMCSGSLVFLVDSWSSDWWYDQIHPMKHYIPVKEDLSNLYEQWKWAENHPSEAASIALNGAAICNKLAKKEVLQDAFRDVINSLPQATDAQLAEADRILRTIKNNTKNAYFVSGEGLFLTNRTK